MFAAVGAAEVLGGLLGVLLLWLLPSYGVARLAQRKGRSFGLWFGFALVFSWFFLLVAVLLLPARSEAASPGT
jgi:hypothetical protein